MSTFLPSSDRDDVYKGRTDLRAAMIDVVLDTSSDLSLGQCIQELRRTYHIESTLQLYLDEAADVLKIGKRRSSFVQFFCLSIDKLFYWLWSQYGAIDPWNAFIGSLAGSNDPFKCGVKGAVGKAERDALPENWTEVYLENVVLYLAMKKRKYDHNVAHSLYHSGAPILRI